MWANARYTLVVGSGHFPTFINAALRRSLRVLSRRFRRLRSSRSRSTRILLTPLLGRPQSPPDWLV